MHLVIFGNSGSGKSTLAKELSAEGKLGYLDLDTIAWTGSTPPQRASHEWSKEQISLFVNRHQNWIIEGCYASLISLASERASHLVFLNPGIDVCRQNCLARPWEPHKYRTKEEQDRNLAMLLDWVGEYKLRTDEFSYQEHRRVFDTFSRTKIEARSNTEVKMVTTELKRSLFENPT